MKTEVAARRLERMDKEKDEEEDPEKKANLQQLVEDSSNAVKHGR